MSQLCTECSKSDLQVYIDEQGVKRAFCPKCEKTTTLSRANKFFVKVDEDVCLGCGLCQSLYPEVFELGTDGHSHVKKGVKIDEAKLKEIMSHCPASGIYIEENKDES